MKKDKVHIGRGQSDFEMGNNGTFHISKKEFIHSHYFKANHSMSLNLTRNFILCALTWFTFSIVTMSSKVNCPLSQLGGGLGLY